MKTSCRTCIATITCLIYVSAHAQQFTDLSALTGFNATGKNHGVAVGDFNGDGLDDIYVCRGDGPNLLYVNQGNFVFEESAAAFRVDFPGNTTCALWFDMDNDGDLDLFLGNAFEPNILYRNDGHQFSEVSAQYGIDVTTGNVRSVNAVDFDGDGDLDLYIAVVLQQNILWRNDGTHFTNVIAESGIDLQGRSLGAVFFDYDLDGYQDLYQTQDGFDGNFLYRNNGDGTFTDVSVISGIASASFGMGATIGDINGDGYPDIYLTNLDTNRLFVTIAPGMYTEIATAAGVADIGMGWSCFFFDYDNNTMQDLYVSNDSYFGIPGHGKIRNKLYTNQGDLTFVADDFTGGVQNEYGSYGAACADFDQDGRLDLAVANEGPNDGNQIFRNTGPAGNYIALRLTGVQSNHFAIGSRVVLYAGGKQQSQQLTAGAGYASQNSNTLHFGLGDLPSIDSVVIFWPSGLRQKSGQLRAGKTYSITEGQRILATGQVVWTEPPFPTKHDDVTVFYDASLGNGALAGFQGVVYAHTGVITSASAHGNDWRHVIGNWGSPDPRVQMTREEEDIYSLSYNIAQFYNVPDHEEVQQMAFVFRNVNGSIVGRDTDGSDIFTDVYPSGSGLAVLLRSPSSSDMILYEDDSLLVDVLVSTAVLLEIYDNDVLLFSEMTDAVYMYVHPVSTGNHQLRIEATRDTTTITITRDYFVIPRVPDRVDPPLGIAGGMNYYTDSTYLFQLYAPLKEFAFLLCPENQYKPDIAFQMQLSEDATTYWIELPKSSFAGGKNTYQYLLSGGIRVADPFSTVVLDPFNDAWVSPEVMATLPPYPDGMTSGVVTAFDVEYTPYDFAITEFNKPDKDKLIIYELLLRDIVETHSFTTLMDSLDYFVRLGINAIELMPVNEFEGNNSWGYNPSYHMAIDKYYGTRDQLKALIDAAHARGIAVIFDVVYNHVFSQSPLAQMYWDATNFRPTAESPYLNVVARHPFNVGYDVNHESPASKAWVKQILTYLITEFNVDGFRFDLSKGFTQRNSGNDAGLMAQYDAGRIAILKDYADHIWNLDPDSYVIMEHFADNSEETELSNYGMMLWGNHNHDFSQAAKGFQANMAWSNYKVRGWNDPHLISYMESHDEERLVFRVLNEGAMSGNYNTRQLTTALRRIEAASTLFYSIPGPKMLWQFGEMGYDFSINRCVNGTINNNCRLDPKPIRWDYLDDYRRERLRRLTAALTHLRTDYPTFSTDDFVFADGNLFVKTVHLNHPEMDAAVLVNFRVINSEVIPKFQYPGVWYEYFTGDSIAVTDTEARITFGPGEYRIYTSKRISPPDGVISAIHDPLSGAIAVFPSVVSGSDWIYGLLPTTTAIRSVIFTSLAGHPHAVRFESDGEDGFRCEMPGQLPAGMYLVTVQTAEGHRYVSRVIKQ